MRKDKRGERYTSTPEEMEKLHRTQPLFSKSLFQVSYVCVFFFFCSLFSPFLYRYLRYQHMVAGLLPQRIVIKTIVLHFNKTHPLYFFLFGEKNILPALFTLLVFSNKLHHAAFFCFFFVCRSNARLFIIVIDCTVGRKYAFRSSAPLPFIPFFPLYGGKPFAV